MNEKSGLIENRRKKIEDMKNDGVELYPNNFRVSHDTAQAVALAAILSDDAKEGTKLSMAGRIIALNSFGKSSFIRFKDRKGQLQAYLQKDRLGEDAYNLFKNMDIGDFAGMTGTLFKTKTGEWTLLADSFRLISKAVKPLPEKYHGLKDPEKRYRQRYLDLIMNEDKRDIFIKRSLIIRTIRDFLTERDFLEVETPMMQTLPGGAVAQPFKTFHNALGIDLYLRIAPELYLKRLVVGGLERVFEINRNFRNEGVSTKHNPEFTMLEFYQAYAVYEDLMDITEQMFNDIAIKVIGKTSFKYLDYDIDFKGPWPRIPMLESLEVIGKINKEIISDNDKLINFTKSKNIEPENSRWRTIAKLFDVIVEPKLIQPTFITQYPVEISPLSRKSEKDPNLTDRFELFIAGSEIANGFSEVNDPEDQLQRFIQQAEDRKAGTEESETHVMDRDYVDALEYGMPPTAGEGIGIDRLTMLLTNSASIREVILFPHMRKKGLKQT